MSADNGIYIYEKNNQYSVKHLVSFYPDNLDRTVIDEIFFGKYSEFITNDKNKAIDYADNLSTDIGYVEHGILFLKESYEFSHN